MSEISLIPTSDRVLIEKLKDSEETRSGIIIPKKEDGSTNIGVVVAVGPGRETDEGKTIKPGVSVGQKVVYSWGDKIEVDGKEYYVVSEGQILGILNK